MRKQQWIMEAKILLVLDEKVKAGWARNFSAFETI